MVLKTVRVLASRNGGLLLQEKEYLICHDPIVSSVQNLHVHCLSSLIRHSGALQDGERSIVINLDLLRLFECVRSSYH
jgi:hypothetical protein